MQIKQYLPRHTVMTEEQSDDAVSAPLYACEGNVNEHAMMRRVVRRVVRSAATSPFPDEKLEEDDADWLDAFLDTTTRTRRDFVMSLEGLQVIARHLTDSRSLIFLSEDEQRMAEHITGQIRIAGTLETGFDPDTVIW